MEQRTPKPSELVREGKPVLVYDGNCGFCRGWVSHWQHQTGDRVRYLPLASAAQSLTQEQCAACEQAIHLFLPDGRVYRGAHAVLRMIAEGGRHRWLLWLYEHIPGVRGLAEELYAFVSRRRMALSRRVSERRPG